MGAAPAALRKNIIVPMVGQFSPRYAETLSVPPREFGGERLQSVRLGILGPRPPTARHEAAHRAAPMRVGGVGPEGAPPWGFRARPMAGPRERTVVGSWRGKIDKVGVR